MNDAQDEFDANADSTSDREPDWDAAREVVDELLAETSVSDEDRTWARSVLDGSRGDV